MIQSSFTKDPLLQTYFYRDWDRSGWWWWRTQAERLVVRKGKRKTNNCIWSYATDLSSTNHTNKPYLMKHTHRHTHTQNHYLFNTICLRFIINHLLNHLGEKKFVFSLEKWMKILHKQLTTSICITNVACYCSSSNYSNLYCKILMGVLRYYHYQNAL